MQRIFQHLQLAVDLTDFLALGKARADSRWCEECANARPCGPHALGQRSLWDDFKFQLARLVEFLEHHRAGTARERADDAANAAQIHQSRQPHTASARIVGHHGEVFGTLFDQPVEQPVWLPYGAEAAQKDRAAILDPVHGVSHRTDNLVNHLRPCISIDVQRVRPESDRCQEAGFGIRTARLAKARCTHWQTCRASGRPASHHHAKAPQSEPGKAFRWLV